MTSVSGAPGSKAHSQRPTHPLRRVSAALLVVEALLLLAAALYAS